MRKTIIRPSEIVLKETGFELVSSLKHICTFFNLCERTFTFTFTCGCLLSAVRSSLLKNHAMNDTKIISHMVTFQSHVGLMSSARRDAIFGVNTRH